MHEQFDDNIRRQLEGLESPVPKDMFDAIRSQPEVSDATFDASLRHKLQSAESGVTTGLFDKMSAGADLTNAPFDGFVQQQLSTYASPVPADMWNRIQQKKDRRRPVAWWWVAAGLVLLLSGGTWYAVQQSSHKKAVLGEQVPPETKAAEKKIEREDVPAQVSDGATKTKPPVLAGMDSSQAGMSPNQDAVTSNGDDFATLPGSTSQNAVSKKADKSVTDKNTKDQASNGLFSSKPRHKKAAISTIVFSGKNSIGSTYDPSLLLNSSREAEELADGNATLNTINLTITQLLRNSAKLLPGQLLKAKPRLPEIPCPTDGYSRRNDWYVDIYSSAFLVNKSISDKTAGKNAKTGFDSTLHRQVSYNAGISLAKNIGKNVLLKTGVQYNQVNETFRLTRINERKLVTTVSVRTVIIAPGDTVRIRDTSVTEYIGTIQRRTQNKLKQWDVPIIISYEFGGEGIRLNANAGIIANIRSAYTGDMIADTTQQIINVTDYNGKPVYKTNVGISLYAGLSIIKPLGERTSLLIEPYARIGLKNIAAEQAWFKQKNRAAGISVGLRYQLNSSRQR